MNWKLYLLGFVSVGLAAFPQNIIGCSGGEDPYNYYTSFFHNNTPEAKGYRPFYYVGYNFLYDETEPVNLSESLAQEWAAYCGNSVTEKDALKFVNKFSWKDMNNIYLGAESNMPRNIPDSLKQNSMTRYFVQSKDLEGLGYLMFAKKAEPFVVGDVWEPLNRDSLKMDKLLKGGQQLYNAAKKDFFKLKYAYQVIRLAHYSGRYNDAIRLYDEYSTQINKTNGVLQPLCLALKAGALFRTGKSREAAYQFSKVFSATTTRRISNFLGFTWSISRKDDLNDYLAYCKNNTEKAAMLALYSLGDPDNSLGNLKEIYALQPSAEVLEVLVVREINKLEEKYLSPQLKKQEGGRNFYGTWLNEDTDSTALSASKEAKELHGFLHKLAQEGKTSNSGLYETGAAYTAYIVRDFASARRYINAANNLSLTAKVKDQLMLTDLLVTISEKNTIDAAFEVQILPSLQWLYQKAKTEKPVTIGWYQETQWRKFYCNLMGEVLAKRYHQQQNLPKEVLCVGAADQVSPAYYDGAVNFLHDKLTSKEVEQMFALMDSKQLNAFEQFLMKNNVITKGVVTDFAGTAYLRDYEYDKAINWFSKTTDKKALTINTNPFIDLLYDREEALPSERKFTTTKLAFAREMQNLQQLAATDKANAAKHYYKYALGLYNMTYYGHAWKLVEYGRSGSDGYFIPENEGPFKREYYGCFSAHDYFKKAMNASTDKNFKARCLFMMAKCAQKQVKRPRYDDFTGEKSWELYEAANVAYFPNFKKSKYFPEFVQQYKTTPFYKEAFNSCSYLRDFVKK